MSGMQDVATLATRYTNLSLTANKIKKNVDRLKQEVRLSTISLVIQADASND